MGAQRCVSFSFSAPQPSQLTSVLFHNLSHSSLHKSKKVPQGPLVIPALKNRDWRELARKRRSASQFVPESAKAATGKDGSVGGLGVKDTINSGPVLSGLQVRAKVRKEEDDGEAVEERQAEMVIDVGEEEETEDQRALRAILAGADGMENTESTIDIIPTPMSEGDAFKQDVEELPDVATLDDYNRVPVAQFGLALLRGMGWKEGTAASRKPGKGMVQPYLPEARPALLGIGAKEREVLDDGSTKKSGANKRPERRYVPVIKQDREGRPVSGRESSRDDRARSPRRDNGSTSVSRRSSRSRSPGRRRDYDDDRRRDSSRRESSYDDRKRDSSRRESSYDSHRKESSRRDYDRPDSDRYASSSKRRD
ncbi:DExH-box splicing factor binding site-domain-containing protein [Mycena metata]|uniref:DExH-box splicing factor binding site-domain-containing protein n=1 Tax=Mycena metata TaxID=1033252 RepID=A0AAD7P020_9AGAR|nr:DExH-box splicing factor binding site-domain-containing protein [Mycena metata]